MRRFDLAGGRAVDLLVGGAKDGPALVMHHGTPSDASLWAAWSDVARANGLRLFSLSAGWSGGGPHALATAHLIAERCRACATLAGVGPYAASDLDFLSGMGPENHAEFGAALRGEADVRAWLLENGATFATVTGEELATAFGGLVPQIDKDVLNNGFAGDMAAEMRRALARGLDGWIDDDLALTRHWGFEVAEMRVPVAIWQGDEDLMVPPSHGAWLAAHIPTAVAKPARGHGHISLVTTFRDDIVRELLEHA
jgi:pimeloyl-ACP methyl ester carboxylesterase